MRTRTLFAGMMLVGLCGLFSASIALAAPFDVPALFSDRMVLQSGKEAAVWGEGRPGETISVRFSTDGRTVAESSGVVGRDERWLVRLPKLTAGSKGRLEIETSANESRKIEDVLVGEVWLGSGQSNMEFMVGAQNVPKDMVASARADAAHINSEIRFFNVVKVAGAPQPLQSVNGSWVIVTPENVHRFSAVSWYFAHALHKHIKAPVGMIVSCWGGTPVEAWMSREMLDSTSVGSEIWQRHNEQLKQFPQEKVDRLLAELKAWQRAHPTYAEQQKNSKTKPEYPYWEASSKVPVGLYNGMLHGVIPYTLKGFLWYQGEANAGRPNEYGELIQTMVKGWRIAWKEELPFYYVELAAMRLAQKEPVEERSWAEIREAQAAVLALPKTGVACALDVGMANDVHPPYKRAVGERLAGLALKNEYGQGARLAESPEFSGAVREGKSIRVSFRYAEGLAAIGDGKLRGFAIAGKEGQWKWAEAKLEGEQVVVSNATIPEPLYVRYGWASNPARSLVNKSGLPLRSFRSDHSTAFSRAQ